MATSFVARDGNKLAFPASVVCASFYNGWEDRKTYTHTKILDEPFTSYKSFVNFSTVNHLPTPAV